LGLYLYECCDVVNCPYFVKDVILNFLFSKLIDVDDDYDYDDDYVDVR